ncbi:MAG TPA: dihydrodipicolinate synthase family protein [Falsiroseomonas sp.]|jgi:4-hydroxy-tetrahydrodipicolinate synthase|nr:dihydrodipicolinate synthase family protein [Falsiroseomonas sp.]
MRYAAGEARDWARANLSGYLTILYTPFHADGSLDEDGLRHNVRRTIAMPGVGGLSVHSLHQEFWALTLAERKRVTELVLEEVAGRVPVVIGCSEPAAANVVELARHAAEAGADLVMVWPPYYGPRDAAGVRSFYEHVAQRIGIGMVVYSTTLSELGYYLTPEQVEALLHLPNVCAVQDTSLNFASYARMMERVGDRICVSTSLEEYFLFGRLTFAERAPRFMIGSSRPVLCQTPAVPHCGRFLDAALRNDFAAAAIHLREISAIAARLQSRYFARGFHHVALFKTLAGLLGMQVGEGWRPALAPPDPRDVEECVAVLRQAGLLDPGP